MRRCACRARAGSCRGTARGADRIDTVRPRRGGRDVGSGEDLNHEGHEEHEELFDAFASFVSFVVITTVVRLKPDTTSATRAPACRARAGAPTPSPLPSRCTPAYPAGTSRALRDTPRSPR